MESSERSPFIALACTSHTLREQKAAAQNVAWALAQSHGAFGLKSEPL